MLAYAITFLVLALIAGVLGSSGLAGTSADIAWISLVVFFVLTLFTAIGRALNRITPL